MSYFRQVAQAALNPSLDSIMGETVTVQPMRTRANFPAERDPSRPTVAAVAIFANPSAYAFGEAPSHHGRLRRDDSGFTPIVTGTPSFSFAAGAAPGLRRGDRIYRHVDSTLYEIKAVKPDGVARIVADVTELGLANQGDL